MSTKFLSKLSDREIFELFLKACGEDEKQLSLEKIERKEDEFKIYIWYAGDLLPFFCSDFDLVENVCFWSCIDYDFWRILLYKKFGDEYARAYFDDFAKGFSL